MIHVQLPDRREITLSEAVTAFVYGAPRDTSSKRLYPTHASDTVEKELHGAALAGRVRFRGLKTGNNKYQEIDPSYFSTRRSFNWNKNQILSWVPCDEAEWDEELAPEWHDVHLDRDQYASLLREIGVSVELSGHSGEEKQTPLKTGLPGRPTSKHLALAETERRIAAGDYPETKMEFSEQIVKAVAKAHPIAPEMSAKTLFNNSKFGELWRRKPPRPK